jgi:hypothetical protein
MVVSYYDSSDGEFLEEGIIDKPLVKGEPVIMNSVFIISMHRRRCAYSVCASLATSTFRAGISYEEPGS